MPAWLEPKLAVTRNGAGGSAVAFPEPFCLAESWLCLISGRKAMKLLTAPDSEIEAGGLGRMQDPFFFFFCNTHFLPMYLCLLHFVLCYPLKDRSIKWI